MINIPLEIEPDEPYTPALDIEPDEAAAPPAQALVAGLVEELGPAALMTVLPADFPLPALIKFVPRAELKIAAEQAATYALKIDVAGPEGLQRADVALSTLRASQKAIEEHFAEPSEIANRLHKSITSVRAEWLSPGKQAIETVGRKVWTEQRRLDDIAAAERRKAQEEEDRRVREAARREAEAAAAAKAPEPVVQELKRQAATATAPPVQTAAPATTMRSTSTVTTWKARIAGSPADAEPNPDVNELTPAQRAQVSVLLKAIISGDAPIAAIAIDWSYLNKRAKADKSTLRIPGIEAYEDGGVRSKGTRARA